MSFDFGLYDYDDPSEPKDIERFPEKNKLFDFGMYEEVAIPEVKSSIGLDETAKDVAQQISAKAVAGAAGSYGNLLDALGLQLKAGQLLPGQQKRIQREFNIVDRLNKGEKVSADELSLLVEDDLIPTTSRLPSTEDINPQIEKATGIGEGKTPLGRIAGRGAQFAGELAAFGPNPKTVISGLGAGATGQSLREIGAPEGVATATEIAGSLLPSGFAKKLMPSGKVAKATVEAGRKIGLTEQQITPLIQGEKKTSFLSAFSRKGEKTKNLFASIKEKLGDSYNYLKSHPTSKTRISNGDQVSLQKKFSDIRNDLSKTLAPSPEKDAALKFIEKSLESIRDVNVTPEYLINFWQDINRSVKWNSIQGGKKALTQLKEPILEVLEKTAPEIAKDFEATNQLYSRYSQIAKKLKPDLVDAFINKGEVLAIAPSALAFMHGNPLALSGLVAESAIRVLSREMLTNPYFQNVAKRLVKNFNQSSLKGATETLKQTKEYLERKYPSEDWTFIQKDQSI